MSKRISSLAHGVISRALKQPVAQAKAQELLAVLEHNETGRVNLLRMRLAARTGPPDWSIEKRYIMVLDESGATDQAIAELKACLPTQWYRAETWELLSQFLAKAAEADDAARSHEIAKKFDVHLPARARSG